MNRTMISQLAYSKKSASVEPSGVVVTLFGDEEEGIDDQGFYVSREEAEHLIYMIADAFDIDLAEVDQ